MDGSSKVFVDEILKTGIKNQNCESASNRN